MNSYIIKNIKQRTVSIPTKNKSRANTEAAVASPFNEYTRSINEGCDSLSSALTVLFNVCLVYFKVVLKNNCINGLLLIYTFYDHNEIMKWNSGFTAKWVE